MQAPKAEEQVAHGGQAPPSVRCPSPEPWSSRQETPHVGRWRCRGRGAGGRPRPARLGLWGSGGSLRTPTGWWRHEGRLEKLMLWCTLGRGKPRGSAWPGRKVHRSPEAPLHPAPQRSRTWPPPCRCSGSSGGRGRSVGAAPSPALYFGCCISLCSQWEPSSNWHFRAPARDAVLRGRRSSVSCRVELIWEPLPFLLTLQVQKVPAPLERPWDLVSR